MITSKKKSWIKYGIAVPFLCILFLMVIWLWPTWPTKARLCRDVEAYLPKSQCLSLDDKFVIVNQAFPPGSTSSKDVKNALGDYLHDEYPTVNGHIEIYYLSVHPLSIGLPSEYIFTYNQNGILRRIDYLD